MAEEANFGNQRVEDLHSLPKHSIKVDVLFKAVGDAPRMKKSRWAIKRNDTVINLTIFLRRYLGLGQSQDNLFIYVASSFAPPLDTEIGTLFDSFSADGTLILQYCKTQAWVKEFLYAAICVILFQLGAYPSDTFRSAFVFGTPVKVSCVETVRICILKTLEALQLSKEGQQELVLRYYHPNKKCSFIVIFRFHCYGFRSRRGFNPELWKEDFALALGKLWIYPPPIAFAMHKGSTWVLLLRNWFQINRTHFKNYREFTTNIEKAHLLEDDNCSSCLPVFSTNRNGINFQVLHVSSKPISGDLFCPT
uniref:Ubiquitin-like protein ATG12 n=1 Tax=Mesocestoides corti TaxID=53468 RepID=A0A5K3ESN1_MESCO